MTTSTSETSSAANMSTMTAPVQRVAGQKLHVPADGALGDGGWRPWLGRLSRLLRRKCRDGCEHRCESQGPFHDSDTVILNS